MQIFHNKRQIKIMTTINKIYGAGSLCCGMVAALTMLSSCGDFLEIKPQDQVILEDFWNEKADVDNIVNGCYNVLQSNEVRQRMMVWGEVRSDNVVSGPNANTNTHLYNVLRENITAKNDFTTWDKFYDVINRCNTVIKYAPGVAAVDPSYTQGDLRATIAEVSALRDLCYFYLIRTFRNVPYSSVAFTDDDQVMDLPATPFEDVLDSLINDLESVKNFAVTRYPETDPRLQTGRITKDAIRAMLCEMYLWKKDYNNCIKYAEEVIKSKADYFEEQMQKPGNRNQLGTNLATLRARTNGYPLQNDNLTGTSFGDAYEKIFVDGMNRETIFELFYGNNTNNYSLTSNPNQPVNSAISSYYGDSRTPKGLLAPSENMKEDVKNIYEEKNKNLDARIYYNYGFIDGVIYKLALQRITITNIKPSEIQPQMDATTYYTEGKNCSQWIIYRLPDIMLLEAEALCQQMREANDSTAIDYNEPLLDKCFSLVNAINKRSLCKTVLQNDDTLHRADYNTKNLMEDLVKRERRRELMYEGKRWYDLVRYAMRAGNTEPVMSAVQGRDDVNKDFAGNFFKKMDAIFWPYNFEEMKVNKNLVPNPAFGSGESTSYEKTK